VNLAEYPSRKASPNSMANAVDVGRGETLGPWVVYIQEGQVMVGRFGSMWSTGEGNGKPFQYSCLENPMNSMKTQNDRILREELCRLVSAQYATGDQWRNNSRKNKRMEPKQKQYPVVDVTGDRSKVQCSKEKYCIETWNVRSMNQGKLGAPFFSPTFDV